MLIAIIDGLEDELKWPDEGEKAQLAVVYEGVGRMGPLSAHSQVQGS